MLSRCEAEDEKRAPRKGIVGSDLRPEERRPVVGRKGVEARKAVAVVVEKAKRVRITVGKEGRRIEGDLSWMMDVRTETDG